MNGLRKAALLSLLLGLAAIAYGAAQGDVRVGLFLIVPFVYGTGPWPFLGMLLLMAAGVLWFMGTARELGGFTSVSSPPGYGRAERSHGPGPAYADRTDTRYADEDAPRGERRVKHGGVVLLGPIPIVWGSERRILPWMVAAGAAMLVLWFLLTQVLR